MGYFQKNRTRKLLPKPGTRRVFGQDNVQLYLETELGFIELDRRDWLARLGTTLFAYENNNGKYPLMLYA